MANQIKKPEIYEHLGYISIADHLVDHPNLPDNPIATPYRSPQNKHNWHKTPLAIVAIITVITASVGLFFTVAQGSLTDVYVASMPIRANINQAELEKKINDAAKKYEVKIKYDDGKTKSFPLSATGVSVDSKKSAMEVKQELSSSWADRVKWWEPIEFELVSKKDQKVLDSFVATNMTQVKEAPVDAALSLEGGNVTVVPDKKGKGSSVTQADKKIANRVSLLSSEPLVLKPMQLPVAIQAKDLEKGKAKAQALVSKPVVFTIAGRTVTATAADIASWTEVTPIPKEKTVDITVNSGKILQYIDKVARRYITPPQSRLVTNTSGGLVVLDPGHDGIDVVNKDKTAATVADKLLKDETVNIDLPVQYTAAKTVETQAFDKWFVADVTTKRMYAYEGTTLVKTFLISAGAPATPTVLGTYKIYSKYRSQTMSGFNADGSRYRQPDVPYVNYFTGGYAIHGNYWRPASWFGNTNSSHGCIGIQVPDAEWIYNWAPIGTTVVTHK